MQINNVDNQVNYNTTNTGNNVHKAKVQTEEKNNRVNDMKKVGKRPEYNKDYTEEEIINAIEDANEEFVAYDRRFEFSIHEKTKQITIKVLDSVTDEIIREVPPEKILDAIAGIWEIAGILVDERV